jgi:hypothetical protein
VRGFPAGIVLSGLIVSVVVAERLDAALATVHRVRDAGGEDFHVQLIVESIDDDPAVLEPDPKPEESPPGKLGIATREGPSYLSRLSHNRVEACSVPDVTYMRISPAPHTGAHAATGWEVSETARHRDLAGALESGPAHDRLETLRDLLKPEPKSASNCSGGA